MEEVDSSYEKCNITSCIEHDTEPEGNIVTGFVDLQIV